jgi:hypothetical protein
MGSVVDKVALRKVFSQYFGFPCQFSFHRLLHTHHHPGLVEQAKYWPTHQVDSVSPHPKKLKKKNTTWGQSGRHREVLKLAAAKAPQNE